VVVEVIIKPLRFLLERFDMVVDAFFALSAIQPAVVERLLQTIAKRIRLALDPIEQPRNFAVADAIRLAGNLRSGSYADSYQHDETTRK
jgi:hypothetical protein